MIVRREGSRDFENPLLLLSPRDQHKLNSITSEVPKENTLPETRDFIYNSVATKVVHRINSNVSFRNQSMDKKGEIFFSVNLANPYGIADEPKLDQTATISSRNSGLFKTEAP